jgi:gas vesicle protein
MNNQSRMILTFLAGAAAGVAIAYLATSDRGEEIIDELRSMAKKVKDNIADRMGADTASAASSASGVESDEFMGV